MTYTQKTKHERMLNEINQTSLNTPQKGKKRICSNKFQLCCLLSKIKSVCFGKKSLQGAKLIILWLI